MFSSIALKKNSKSYYSVGTLFLTSITTFIGFLSLVLAALLRIQRLGLSLAFNIASVFLVTIVLVPAILSLQYTKKIIKHKLHYSVKNLKRKIKILYHSFTNFLSNPYF